MSDTRTDDGMAEVDAMKALVEAFRPLDAEAVKRVLSWAFERYGLRHARASEHNRYERPRSAAAIVPGHVEEALPDLFAAAHPTTDTEKVLTVAYWLQEVDEVEDLTTSAITQHLKHLGHPVSNVARALIKLVSERPQPIIQTRKAGSTRQARKSYRVTAEGKRQVESMFGRGRDQEDDG